MHSDESQSINPAAAESRSAPGRERRSRSQSDSDDPRLPLIGVSPAIKKIRGQVAQAAGSDIPVLLIGETGTGKDLIAHTIHVQSERAPHPYIPVNLGSLPSELIASELFGHKKGAFTGAATDRAGVFERASKGSILLDEIDSMDQRVQISLLRVLEEKRVTPLGSTGALTCGTRVIAATNADLTDLVHRGLFRKDLFYRLEAFRIIVPPLRERVEDIPLLVENFMSVFTTAAKKKFHALSDDVMRIFVDYPWPGNVRELRNVVQRAVLLSNDGRLRLADLPERLVGEQSEPNIVSFRVGTSLHDVEKKMLEQALLATNNNRKEAARLLGISRRAIYNKLHKHGFALKQSGGSE